MKKFKLTLKWRFTLLTLVIMILTSAILVDSINYDIKKTMPGLTDLIIDIYSFENNETYGIIIPNYMTDNNVVIIDNAIGETVSNIYTTSIITFCFITILGCLTTYFVVNKALKPVIDLNHNIKEINEDNLTCTLNVQGPHDEIQELAISFNKMLAKLENAFASQKRFNSSVAHELKTPLAVIKTNIDVLKSNEETNIEEYKTTIEVVEKSVLKMNGIIETLLDIIRQENEPLNDRVNVSVILEDVVEDLKVIASKSGISIEVNIEEIEDEMVGNEILLYRALYNIIENAIKYNKPLGTVTISCMKEQENIYIKISDTGEGIAVEEYENIFKPFYRCQGTNLSSNSGIGLGLSLTQSAIKMHGGEITVNSIINQGTEFLIILPIVV